MALKREPETSMPTIRQPALRSAIAVGRPT